MTDNPVFSLSQVRADQNYIFKIWFCFIAETIYVFQTNNKIKLKKNLDPRT